MSGPRGGKTDWTDPEQVRAYHREYMRKWYGLHGPELNERKREARRNKPAAPGTTGRGRKDAGWLDAAYCTENRYAEEISWDIDKEKIRRNREE